MSDMTSITLPIFGQGSQPADEDGTELEYLHMPENMATYAMPVLDETLPAQANAVLQQLSDHLAAFPEVRPAVDLLPLTGADRDFINQALGEGEVAMTVTGGQRLHIQEAVLAGVWRLQSLDANGQIAGDALEVGTVPNSVRQTSFEGAAEQIDVAWTTLPPGVMNAPPLLAELNAKIAAYRPGADAHTINLSLLPQTEEDLAFLAQRLGKGTLTILSRGYGNCRISATATRYVWWVQYFNSQDILILNTLEVADVPGVACAAAEDIADSYQRLQEMLKVYG
ncbi:MAG: hydrogenase expression/formation protein [Gammaproteobacteria bacterium]